VVEIIQGEKFPESSLKSVDEICFPRETNDSRPSYLGEIYGG
jgi:hypothetical protein